MNISVEIVCIVGSQPLFVHVIGGGGEPGGEATRELELNIELKHVFLDSFAIFSINKEIK